MCWFVDSICIMALLLTGDVMNNPWKAKAAKKVELPSAFFLFLQFFYFILSSSFSSSSSYSYSEKDMKSCAEISISSLERHRIGSVWAATATGIQNSATELTHSFISVFNSAVQSDLLLHYYEAMASFLGFGQPTRLHSAD